MNGTFSIKSLLVDLHARKTYPAEVIVNNGFIGSVREIPLTEISTPGYIMPGFVDSHVHIESSLLVPAEFARLAVVHGTVATVSDPHEIANVCGMEGIDFMISNGNTVPFKFFFGAPSCVPATTFETSGAEITTEQVKELMSRKEILYLSEMMNFPGVLNSDPEVMRKIQAAKDTGKPIDGHAPGLRGKLAEKYISAGISTDHECFTAEEAREKLSLGMKILIREGSAAKNFEALIELLSEYPESIMFCSDDKHPDSLIVGHINKLCSRAVGKGLDLYDILRAACINPVEHYGLEVGLLREGDPADFIITEDLSSFKVLQTYINGVIVADKGKSLISSNTSKIVNHFNCSEKSPIDFQVPFAGQKTIPVIEALDGQLITNRLEIEPTVFNNTIASNTGADIVKIVVVSRYNNTPVAKAFIKNTGLKSGALASSVAHDSHNIVAIGVDDESIMQAVNLIIRAKGGLSAVYHDKELILELPVAGLMSIENGYKVAADYTALDKLSKEMGSTLGSPFMTLSFMALLVIPHLKLSDLGLFDGDSFQLVDHISHSLSK